MKSDTNKIFAGFGFGPIQSALFLYEAYQTGNFTRFAVVDIDAQLIEAVRGNGGRYTVNIARPNRIDRATVEGVELFDPNKPEEAERFVAAVADSDEMCTALPNVNIYGAGAEASVISLMARGLKARAGTAKESMPTIVYTAENNNRAAEILEQQVSPLLPVSLRNNVQFLNTVIAKMSGVIGDADTIERLGLARIAPGSPRAILVEEFNRILISSINFSAFRRGIEVFVEKEDLLPFEEVKLYGHNAIHAFIAYLADLKGYEVMSEAGKDKWIMKTARRTLVEESGMALIRANAGINDPLFTEKGYTEFTDDLLGRIVNPNLNDLVMRVGRDHPRKLGIEDRLYGTMVIALENGVTPRNLGLGAAAGVLCMIKRRGEQTRGVDLLPDSAAQLSRDGLESLLRALWGDHPAAAKHGRALVTLTWEGVEELRRLGLAG